VSDPGAPGTKPGTRPRTKLTYGQRSVVAGLLVLQIPSGLIFYSLAAVFAITGIFVPVSMALMSVGTMPFSFAMKCRDRWRSGIPQASPGGRLDPAT